MKQTIALLAAAIALGAFASPAGAQRVVEKAPDPNVHSGTGLLFHARLGHFERERVVEYDRDGRDAGINYVPEGVDWEMLLSIYIYPADQSCTDNYHDTITAVARRAGSRLIDSALAIERPGFEKVEQHSARFAFAEGTLGSGQPAMVSDLWIACPAGGRYLLKLRASYDAEHAAEGAKLVADLVAELDWKPLLEAP